MHHDRASRRSMTVCGDNPKEELCEYVIFLFERTRNGSYGNMFVAIVVGN
jgi:hypothetical protein